jgi:hypothetical protein
MKKLGKLSINPSKVMKNEELVNLKGGGYDVYLKCYRTNGGYCLVRSQLGCSEPAMFIACSECPDYNGVAICVG